MKKEKVHFGYGDFCNLACGTDAVSFDVVREITFDKRRVTCKNCKRTKVFKQSCKKDSRS